MDEKMIRQRVKDYYWQHDLNCATVTLKILAEQYSLELSDQVLDISTMREEYNDSLLRWTLTLLHREYDCFSLTAPI